MERRIPGRNLSVGKPEKPTLTRTVRLNKIDAVSNVALIAVFAVTIRFVIFMGKTKNERQGFRGE